jgi:hypothetical protein
MMGNFVESDRLENMVVTSTLVLKRFAYIRTIMVARLIFGNYWAISM